MVKKIDESINFVPEVQAIYDRLQDDYPMVCQLVDKISETTDNLESNSAIMSYKAEDIEETAGKVLRVMDKHTSKYEKEYHDKLSDGFAIVYEIDKVANEAIDRIRELSNELDGLFKR